jgi:hypothetical protein
MSLVPNFRIYTDISEEFSPGDDDLFIEPREIDKISGDISFYEAVE